MKGYFDLDFLLLVVYVGWNVQFSMARHHHHRRPDCLACPPGYGVERPCSRLHDTECGACRPEHYSSHASTHRPCYPCSRCGPGLYVAHRCTAARDTVCDSCHTYRGPHNEDFYQRCVLSNDTEPYHHSQRTAKKSESVVSSDLTRRSSSSFILTSSIAIGTLIVIIIAACTVASKRYLCRRVNNPYQAVATKDAIML